MSNPDPMRLRRLQQFLVEQACDAAVIMNPVNIRYLTGFSRTGVLLVTPTGRTLFVEDRYVEQAGQQVNGIEIVEAPDPVLPYALYPARNRFDRLGYEANHLTVLDQQALAELVPGTQLVGLRNAVERLRAIKDEAEVALIRRAIEITEGAFAKFCNWMRPGLTENYVATRLEHDLRSLGGERIASGWTILCSGTRTSLPDAAPTDKIIDLNEPIMFDLGTTYGGYCSDITRTVYLGQAPDEFKKLYQVVLDAQEQALESIRAGMTSHEACALASGILGAAAGPPGYPRRFHYVLGHGVGLDGHDLPNVIPTANDVLEENMVVTIEPGLYIPGFAGVRIEDMVRITATGCELLSQGPRTLVEIQAG